MKPTFETVLEELEAALARAERAEAREVELERVLERMVKGCPVCRGRGWFAGVGLDGELDADIPCDHCSKARKALASPSPVAEAMGRVVEAVGREIEAEEALHYALLPDDIDEKAGALERMKDERTSAYDALLAARKGEG